MKKVVSVTALIALGAAVMSAQAQNTSTGGSLGIVEVAGGRVQGVETDVPGVTVFKGIPFAASTAGENRWRAPQPVEPWEGVRVADTWGDQVMQHIDLNPVGTFWGDEFYYDPEFIPPASENGLNLNVFTPAQSAADNLPVYVWIHGGGNDHGYASEIEFWAPKLAAKGIIVVPVQYRVGPFGFMALSELAAENPHGMAGNYALYDLIAALEWVRDNIGGFGGDPSTVTIGGQSAGGINVATLLRSPLARGLFQRAVMQSNIFGILPTDYPTLAEKTAANEAAITEIFGRPMSLEDFRAVPAQEFITRTVGDNGTSLFSALNSAVAGLSGYVLDGVSLTEASVDLLRPGALDGIDIMIGGTSDEWTSLAGGPDNTMNDEAFAAALQEAYGDADQDVYEPSSPQDAYRMSLRARADYWFQAALVSAQYAKAHNNTNVFAYYFNQIPPGRNDAFYGAYHSSDLWYFFNSLREWPGQRQWTDADYRMAETLSSYLANFVRTGDPNGAGLPEWPQPTTEPAFIRLTDGYAYPVDSTPHPARDALNRETVLEAYDLTEDDLSN